MAFPKKKKSFPFAKPNKSLSPMTMDQQVLKGGKMPGKGLKGYKVGK